MSVRRAYTLVEAVVSLGIAGILMTGLGSGIMLASRALPDADDAHRAAIHAALLLEDIATELATATSVTERTAATLAFVVADRDNDGTSESIRYSWAGTAGDPLQRQYNANAAVTIAENVRALALNYDYYTTTTTAVQTVTATSPVTVLASFESWPGIAPTETPRPVSASDHLCQCFQFVPPAGATSLTVTRALVTMYRDAIAPASFSVAIRRPSAAGAATPAATPIGTPATVAGGNLSTMPLWTQITFSNVTVTDLTNVELCLVLSGSETTSVWAVHDNDRAAPANGTTLMWSTDGGASWNPATRDIDKNDLKFYVYGTYESSSTQEVTTQRDFLTGVTLAAQLHDAPSATVRTTARLLNAPEVTTP